MKVVEKLERAFDAHRAAYAARNFALAASILDDMYSMQSKLPYDEHNLPTGPDCGYNKLGIHVINSLTQEVVQTGLPIFCAGGEYGKVDGAPGLTIGAKTVGYDGKHQYNQMPDDPDGAAAIFVADYIDAIGIDIHIKRWCGHNEFVPVNKKEMQWYAAFEIERMRLMAEHGYKCVIGNFFTGGPEFWMWQYFLPAIVMARIYDGWLGLHEYSAVALNWMCGDWQKKPGETAGDAGWGTLRYRLLYRYVLEPVGFANVPLVITECGIDAGVIPPQGWLSRFFRGMWPQWQEKLQMGPEFYWFGKSTPERLYHGLKWYNKELQKDDFVVAGFVFTFGNFGGLWKQADINETPVMQELLRYQAMYPHQWQEGGCYP